MSNTASASLLFPIAMGISTMSSELRFIALSLAVVTSTSMILPVSTPPNAIAYASGLISKYEIFKNGFFVWILSVLVIIFSSIVFL